MEDETIERVAKAICRVSCTMTNHWNPDVGCNLECRATKGQLELQRREARAAIEAIRTPTVDMVDYVEINHNTEDEDAALRARIEAAIRATPVSEREEG